MQLWLCCALLVVAAGGCLAQRPRPCKSPPLLEGSLTMGSSDGGFGAYANFAYDAFRQRFRFAEIGRYENETFYEDALLLYQERVMYRINYRNKSCQKQKLTSQFQPIRIPCDASFLAQVVLGSLSVPLEGLLVNTWTGEVPEDQGQYIMTFTDYGCLPVNVLYNSPKTGWIVTNWINMVRGIRDPSVFIPPPFCRNATLETEEDGDFFSAFI